MVLVACRLNQRPISHTTSLQERCGGDMVVLCYCGISSLYIKLYSVCLPVT